MDSLSPLRRVYYSYLSRMYALLYAMSRRSFLGMRLSTLARWLPILALLVGLIADWPLPVMIGLLLVTIWIHYSFWRAKRDNYNRFIAHSAPPPAGQAMEPLPPNRKLPVRATGLFSVSGRENSLLLRPAHYWRVPLGDHVVMAEEDPGKYLYQFFDGRTLQEVQPGWLLFGARPVESLAVTFLARWGPEYTRFGPSHETGNDGLPPPKRVTVYLSAEDETVQRTIHQTIVEDARQTRLNNP